MLLSVDDSSEVVTALRSRASTSGCDGTAGSEATRLYSPFQFLTRYSKLVIESGSETFSVR